VAEVRLLAFHLPLCDQCTNIAHIEQTQDPPMTDVAQRSTSRSSRLGIRATPAQEAILKRAAEARHKSLTEFILDSACSAAEQTLLDQRLFVVPTAQYEALLKMLDRPARANPGLKRLFSKKAPWEKR